MEGLEEKLKMMELKPKDFIPVIGMLTYVVRHDDFVNSVLKDMKEKPTSKEIFSVICKDMLFSLPRYGIICAYTIGLPLLAQYLFNKLR